MEDIYSAEDWISLAWNLFLLFLLMDFLSYGVWAISGQVPLDGVYFGTVTAHIIALFS